MKMYKLMEIHARIEVFTAVTMNNVFFWYIKPQVICHRKNITALMESPAD
jgi:hypothetical protein